ncbi:MAG: HAD hydrolase-like protein [Methylotenera sp.]|uniref:HAD family hydrolase n=1 Tax=Methylotenera sp. TaxID=2051956 RepID=UPI00271F45BC|nr:HAD family hydrolase [Methylotenera sp.]MDO9206110.1 HAD hydrolase-like protein [Methylotenera sp.]MDO9394407.1 HAD hydrolase-like protein [Methylotenera sp.]MDP1522163.1 HAD hydrolase-like protein [Methylotenera sp.]MDP3140860.1 HAD hydrolase-like protein [Methylotenera sp.]
MKLDITKYKTIVFDCDGVVLDSNVVKTEAYFRTAKNLGATDLQAQALVDYHVKLGGISRYHKFDYYLREILFQPFTEKAIQALLDDFSKELEAGLMQCDLAKGLFDLRTVTPNANWMILSGGDQQEIQTLFAKRKIDHMFDGGLFGSPDNKDEVLAREIANANIQFPALFLGDSKYDFEAADRAKLDFIFLSDWTEVPDWQEFCAVNKLTILRNIAQLVSFNGKV